MKRTVLFFSAAAVLSAAALVAVNTAWSAPDATTRAGDTIHSFVLFKIKHNGTGWAYGRFNDFTVSVGMNDAGTEITSVAFDVKTESVDTGQPARDKHLKSPDFFNAKQFPDVTFKSTSVKAVNADAAEVTGDLTLHGVTKPVVATVSKVGTGKGMKGEDLVGLESTFTIKRTDFGMSNMVGVPGVGDDVTLTVAVEAAKK
jgi:polyisoprenoid-binding protein YceI